MNIHQCQRIIDGKGRLINRGAIYNNLNYTIQDVFPASVGKIIPFTNFYLGNRDAANTNPRFIHENDFEVYVFLENDVTNQNLIVLLDNVQVL